MTDLARNLIFDVGMHRGEDTAFYLKKGFRVVGFEANPDLVALNRQRFAAEVDSGDVTIVQGAIAGPGIETVSFYRHPTMSVWGTITEQRVDANAKSDIERIEVPTVDFAAQIRAHGVPWYLKIDIEGADLDCLVALGRFTARPGYVSIESDRDDFARIVEELDTLQSLGYDRFAAVQQSLLDHKPPIHTRRLDGTPIVHKFEAHGSGPFGEDISNWLTRPEIERAYRTIFWRYRLSGRQSRSELGYRVRHRIELKLGRAIPGWFDTHATTADVLNAA